MLDLDSNDDLDITSTQALLKLVRTLDRRLVQLAIAHLHDPARAVAERVGHLDAIGPGHVLATWAPRSPGPSPSAHQPADATYG